MFRASKETQGRLNHIPDKWQRYGLNHRLAIPFSTGGIMRSVARIKLGYYPLPSSEGARLRRLLIFTPDGTSVLDPCAGTGAALLQLTEGVALNRYAVELDADRAQQAGSNGIKTLHANLFDVQAKVESVSLLYLNPPYDSEVAASGNQRMELLFLRRTLRWLVFGGVLVMVVPHAQLHECIDLLADNFSRFQVHRLSDPESERFDQVVLLAVRTAVKSAQYQANRERLLSLVWQKQLPVLSGDETPYDVPPTPPAEFIHRGLPLDELEDLVVCSSAWDKVRSFLLPKQETTVGRPITPLHGGHVGLLCTAGLLNGVFGEGTDRHIARWRTVKFVTTYEEKIEGYTEIHKRERFSNELALVYADGRRMILTDKKKENKDAELTSAPRAA
jgi:16S rRNA G966 N2-methylase RsmD